MLDADDIARLYAAHARALVAYFARRTFDAQVAAELMAETFASAVADRRRVPRRRRRGRRRLAVRRSPATSSPTGTAARASSVARSAQLGLDAARAERRRVRAHRGARRAWRSCGREVADGARGAAGRAARGAAAAGRRGARLRRRSPPRSASTSRPPARGSRARCAGWPPRGRCSSSEGWTRGSDRGDDLRDAAPAVASFGDAARSRRARRHEALAPRAPVGSTAFGAAARRPRAAPAGGARRARRLGVALAVVLPIAATSGAATAVVLREAVIPPTRPGAACPTSRRRSPARRVVSALRAKRPRRRRCRGRCGSRARKTGFTCTTVGQVRDARVRAHRASTASSGGCPASSRTPAARAGR